MKCVVTGGCGFVGSHLVNALIEGGHHITVLDDLSTGSVARLDSRAQFVKGSITDIDCIKAVVREADWVFHLAAWARVPRSIDDPIGTHHVNVNGTLNVLEAIRDSTVCRLVYASSSKCVRQPVNARHE